MTRYGSEFPEPPWTYAPKEVEEWLTGVAKAARVAKMEAFKNEADHTLENVEIVLDVDAARTRIRPSNAFLQWLRELTGRPQFEAHFEVPAVVELVARALATARFHAITKVVVDGKTEFDHPGRPKDVRGLIELLTEASHRATRCDAVQFYAVDDDVGDTTAAASVKRVLKKGEHAIGVRYEGTVAEDDFRKFLAYLSRNLNATFEYNGSLPQA